MKTNNTTLKSRNTSAMAGIDKHITTSITIDGTTFTQADLKALFRLTPRPSRRTRRCTSRSPTAS